MTATSDMVSFRDVGVTYPDGTVALQGLTLDVAPGFVVVLGRSGAGKSTLLRTINGLVPVTSGALTTFGTDVQGLSGRELRLLRSRVGMIFQQFNLLPRLRVLDNVLVGRLKDQHGVGRVLSLGRAFAREDEDQAYQCLVEVGIGDLAFKRARDLSGGQQQRVSIARALAQKPDLILADEPIASLDPESAKQVMRNLRDVYERQRIPVLVNLHQVEVARAYATRIVGVARGHVVFDGESDTLTDASLREIYDEAAA